MMTRAGLRCERGCSGAGKAEAALIRRAGGRRAGRVCQDTTLSDSLETQDMAAARKRKHPGGQEEEEDGGDIREVEGGAEKRRSVMFEAVRVFNFSRRQGHTCVPSQVSGVVCGNSVQQNAEEK